MPGMSSPHPDADLASLSCLDDPVRGRLYEIVRARTEPVGRDEAAAAAGIARPLAVYHLDKLVESGLLEVTYQRLTGRSGPGAGRPAKLYTRSDREFAVSVPPRDYELAARVLVRAVEADQTGASLAAVRDAAFQLGRELGGRTRPAGRDLTCVLAEHGYEPVSKSDVIRLRNCPFRQLASRHRETVCGMNLALIEGLISGLGVPDRHPVLDPRAGHCCVAVTAGGERS
jgi:predicted ArsR family transcriptional regulator